jgi:hypothetical protein
VVLNGGKLLSGISGLANALLIVTGVSINPAVPISNDLSQSLRENPVFPIFKFMLVLNKTSVLKQEKDPSHY